MVRDAIAAHAPFDKCEMKVYAKGSYANNTNVRADSDVDIAVECTECCYWTEQAKGDHPDGDAYSGIWTPTKLRAELAAALEAKFPDQVDASGSIAIGVEASTARVDADVVPCFSSKHYFSSGAVREGTKVFSTSGQGFNNYPAQQLANGRDKNVATGGRYKNVVRILKRVGNAMVEAGTHREVPSFFVECIAYNCPDVALNELTWKERVKACLVHVWSELEGAEPDEESKRWLEVNQIKYLFHDSQKWTREDGRDFAGAAWKHLGLE